jgi:hypothetical protein
MSTYHPRITERVITEVLSIERLPLGANGSRRAVVRWSDGTIGEPMRWFDDEILFTEGDFIGKTEAELRHLHFKRDRDYLQSDLGS